MTGVLGGGGGRGRWSSGRPVSICDGGWTTTVSVYKLSPQSIVAVRRVRMMVGSHPSPIAPEADIKTFPSPPPPNYRKNRQLYRRACFRKFPKLSGTKVQNVRTGVLGFLMLGKGVNTRTNNLRVHTVGSDTRTTSVGTTARSGWLEWRNHGCSKVTGTTSIYIYIYIYIYMEGWLNMCASFYVYTLIWVNICNLTITIFSTLYGWFRFWLH